MSELPRIQIPSKTFLIGEYSVLNGGCIHVWIHSPCFEAGDIEECSIKSFHPESPAGLALEKLNLKKSVKFYDPHKGKGGFGGSTAEVISVLSLNTDYTVDEAYEFYMNLFDKDNVQPSGADFYAQWLAHRSIDSKIFIFDKRSNSAESYFWPFKDIAVLIFKRTKKIQTQTHLNSLKDLKVKTKTLHKIAQKATVSFKNKDKSYFDFIDEFASEQSKVGLLLKDTRNDVNKIKKIEGVITARGCGALGADVIAVFCVKNKSQSVVKKVTEISNHLFFVD